MIYSVRVSEECAIVPLQRIILGFPPLFFALSMLYAASVTAERETELCRNRHRAVRTYHWHCFGRVTIFLIKSISTLSSRNREVV